jgi:HAD superfamily hydrolase (TIGR01509 family)
MAGRTAADIIRETFPIKDNEQLDYIIRLKESFFSGKLWKQVKPFPGAQKLLDSLKGKVKLAIATSASIDNVIPILNRLKWQGYFKVIVAREDVKYGKPDPEMLVKVCDRLKLKPSEAVYLGDAVYDMTAAKAAGMMSVGVSTGTHTKQQLEKAGADSVFENLFEAKDFLMHL